MGVSSWEARGGTEDEACDRGIGIGIYSVS